MDTSFVAQDPFSLRGIIINYTTTIPNIPNIPLLYRPLEYELKTELYQLVFHFYFDLQYLSNRLHQIVGI